MKNLHSVIWSRHRKFEKQNIIPLRKKQFFLFFPVTAKIKMKNYLNRRNN